MDTKNELVVKSNRLVEASYRLTLVEQRIILLAIVEARRTSKGLNADDFVDIAATAYAAMFDIPLNKAYEQIKEAGKTLFRRYVVLHDIHPESGKPRMTEVRWLSAASYIDGAGTIQLRFAPDMVPFIIRLEAQFTRYKLEKVANMSSAYAIRLYELLMQWGSVGRREIELQWLRKALGLENEYPSIKNFKKRVIDVALSQVNEHSDLAASYTQRKTGRVVTHLIFTFALKEEATAEQAPPKGGDTLAKIRESALFKRLRGHGIGERLAAAWLRQDEARARATVEYVEARAKQGLVKGSTAGYLRTLFEEGAEVGKSTFEAGLEARVRAAAESARRAEAEKRAKAKADEEAKAALLALAPEARLALAAAYRAGAGAALSASWDEGKGDFRDPMERIQFKVWLKKALTDGRTAAAPPANPPEPKAEATPALPETERPPESIAEPEPMPPKGILYKKLFGKGKAPAP